MPIRMATISLQDIPLHVTRLDLIYAIQDVLHHPPFHDGIGQAPNFSVQLDRDVTDEYQHSGTGTLTIADDLVVAIFISMYGDPNRPRLNTTSDWDQGELTFSLGVPPPTDVIQELENSPFVDPRVAQGREARKAALGAMVGLHSVQFGWLCRDNRFSPEWQADIQSLSDLPADNTPSLRFNADSNEIWISLATVNTEFETLQAMVVVRFSRIEALIIDTAERSNPGILFTFLSPPALEIHEESDGIFGQEYFRRYRCSAFGPTHTRIIPYTLFAMRVTCASQTHMEELRRMARAASLPRPTDAVPSPIVRRSLFSPNNLDRIDGWLEELPWSVAFQALSILNAAALDPIELWNLRPRIEALVSDADFGVAKAGEVLRGFGSKLKDPEALIQDDESIVSCFESVKADLRRASLSSSRRTRYFPPLYCFSVALIRVSPGSRTVFSDNILPIKNEDNLHFRWDREVAGARFVKERVGGVLEQGLNIAGRHFEFLAYSNSALREHAVWFSAPFQETDRGWITAQSIRDGLGDFYFDGLECQPAKLAARMSQAFTATEPSVTLSLDGIPPVLPDIGNFTDGVGEISRALARRIVRALGSSGRKKRFFLRPSAFQFRMGGYKGVLMVNPKLKGNDIRLRPSQQKFLWLTLGGQGPRAVNDGFLNRSIRFARNHVLREMKHRARIPVKGSYTLVGVADPTGDLPPNTIFACVQLRDEKPFCIKGRVLITRSPQVHPGDVQFVEAIGKPPTGSVFEHERYYNCVVFSIQGERSVPSMLAGGDLDAQYPRVLPKDLSRPCTTKDLTDWVTDYINSDILGLICQQFLVTADCQPEMARHPQCITLAGLASRAVDFAKSGQPVGRGELPKAPKAKPDWSVGEIASARSLNVEIYESQTAIGKLFRNINLNRVHQEVVRQANREHRDAEEEEGLETSLEELEAVLNSLSSPQSRNPVRHHPISDALRSSLHLNYIDASSPPDPSAIAIMRRIYPSYTTELRSICSHHSITKQPLTEEEVIVGTIASRTSQPRHRKAMIQRMRAQADELVKSTQAELREGDDGGELKADDEDFAILQRRLRVAWLAWCLSVELRKTFGAKSFGFIALAAIFDGMRAIDVWRAENETRPRSETPEPSTSSRPPESPALGAAQETTQGGPIHATLRAQANAEGDAMGRCFRESREAYRSGDRARAKELSDEGKLHKAEMEELNRKAPPHEIDLHGLYVNEAIERANHAIIAARERGDRQLHFIVGRGMHSRDSVGKLRVAIEDLIAMWVDYPFKSLRREVDL
ncbi:hypothetical protein FRC00_006648 [Tulasnella sp. 408]|nr:hypothetical protein FRC00_006648 [Tulasnella sp. 408]